MSYFIANNISFNKKEKKFKVKGGDNNIIPRENYWSNELPLTELFYVFNSGDVQYPGNSNEKLLKIEYFQKIYRNEISENFPNVYMGYYHLHRVLSKDRDYFIVSDENRNSKSEYTQKEVASNDYIYENYDEIKTYLNDFNERFINDVLSKKEEENSKYYIIVNQYGTESYTMGVSHSGGGMKLNITYQESSAKTFSYYQALHLIKGFDENRVKIKKIEK